MNNLFTVKNIFDSIKLNTTNQKSEMLISRFWLADKIVKYEDDVEKLVLLSTMKGNAFPMAAQNKLLNLYKWEELKELIKKYAPKYYKENFYKNY